MPVVDAPVETLSAQHPLILLNESARYGMAYEARNLHNYLHIHAFSKLLSRKLNMLSKYARDLKVLLLTFGVGVAELVDATGLKPVVPRGTWGFESPRPHHNPMKYD